MRKSVIVGFLLVPIMALAAFWWETYDPGASGFKMQDVTVVGAEHWFEEDFDGPGYENTSSPGPWDESNDVSDGINDANTDLFKTGSSSLYVDGQSVSGTNHYTFIDLGVGGPTDYYWRLYFRSEGTSFSEDCWFGLDDNATTPASRDNGGIWFLDTDDMDLFLYNFISGSVSVPNIATGVWHYVEVHYPSGDWKLNGTNQTSMTADSVPQALRYIIIGDGTGAGSDGNVYFDALAISTNDWVGPVP